MAAALDEPHLLQSVPLFASLPGAELRTIAAHVVSRAYRRGEIIFFRGDPGETLYVVQEGRVKISLPGLEGTDITLAVLGPGDFFGEMALLDGLPRSATATAIAPSRLLSLTREQFLAALHEDRHLALTLMRILGRRVRQANEMIEDIVTLDIPARLAKKLLDLAESRGVATPAGTEVQLRLTQTDLAAMIGATRESTNKVLRGFILRGWVAVDAHHVIITRPEELRRRIY
jgi:CRP/FNR family transcriptional regulator/CRP/FNR family cyclic AMP-dependent transcriptional regulator